MQTETIEAPKRKRTREFPTRWSGWINLTRPNGTTGGASVYGNDLPGLIADIVRTSSYYLAMGYKAEVGGMERACSNCSSCGRVRTKKGAIRTCPACKGDPIVETMPDFPIAFHENVKATI